MRKLLLFACLAISLMGCGSGLSAVFHKMVIGTAAGVKALEERSATAYQDHAETVRRGLLERGSRDIAEYDRLMVDANAELDRRTAAIIAASSSLYAATTLKQALGGELDAATVARVARSILTAVRTSLTSLSDGLVLPPVPIPAEVRQGVNLLEGLAGAVSGEK